MKSVTNAPCPEDAAVIASLTVSLESLLRQPGHPYSVTILVRVNSAGKRFIQYVVPLVSKNACGSFLRTDSLVALSRFFRRESEPPKVTVFPRTRFAFPGNTLAFSYVYSGPGKIIEETWETGEIGKRSRSAPTIKLEKKSVTVNCLLKVELDIGGEAPIIVEVNGGTTVNPLVITSHVTEREALFTPNGTGTIDLHWGHGSPILNELDVPIPPEGGSVSFSGGTLEASRNRVIRHSGSVSPKIADPASSPCRLQFDKPGYAEFVFDLQLQYRFQEETYSWASTKPEISALAGVFQTSGKMEFVRIPPGIIEGTARFLDLKKLTIDINGLAKTVLRPGDLVFDPPWELARSSLFPASPPIALTKIIPEVLGTIEDGSPSLPMESENGFRHKIDSLGLAQNDGEFLLKVCYRLFPTDSNMGSPLVPILSPLPIKALPATIARVEIDPPGPSTIREGEKLELAGTAMPQEELGTGEINETENTFDLLDGYKASRGSIEWLSWLSNEDEEGKRRDDGWKFPFKPEVGLGTYSVLAVSTIDVREEETGSEIQVIGTGSTQVVVIPGLRILSPIDKYVYPQGAEVAVVTTIDKDPEEWQKIQWTLNGKPWNPGTSAPPARLLLDKSQKWRLGAQLKTVDSENHELILSDTVSFQTKPFSASLTPKRAIYPWKAEFSVPLPIEVKLNNTPIKELKKEVPLVPGEFVAWVEDITWVHGADPESCATFEVGASPFQASMKFSEPGAFTTLATVTIKVKPIGGDSDSEESLPILTFSYTLRSDLWTIPQPIWDPLTSDLPDEQFPNKAISPAGRTFTIKDGVVSLKGEKYPWSPQSGFPAPIEFQPAIPSSDITPARCNKVKLAWSCPDNETSDSFTYIPTFKKPGTAVVKLQSYLVFDAGADVAIEEKNFFVAVEDIHNLVEYYVNPKSFQMAIGESKIFDFILKAKEDPHPTTTINSQTGVNVPLLNGVYNLQLVDAEWHFECGSISSDLTSGLAYDFSPHRVGEYKICVSARCQLKEATGMRNKDRFIIFLLGCSSGSVQKPTITFYLNGQPLGESSYYLGQKVTLSFMAHFGSQVVAVNDYKWENFVPKPVLFIHDTSNFSTGFAMELQSGALENNSPTFILYNHLSEENKQKWSLTYQLDGQTFTDSGELTFKAPQITDIRISQTIPTIFNSSVDPAFPVIGFPGAGPNGTRLLSYGENNTDVKFDIGVVQLIRYFDSYVHTSGNTKYVDMNDFRLDNQNYPYGVTKPFFPGTSWQAESIYFDAPETPIAWAGPSAPLNSIKYSASTKFKIFVVCKPDVQNSEWVPLSPYLYEWHWAADAQRNGESWFLVDGSFFPNEIIDNQPPTKTKLSDITFDFPVGFPKWDRCFKKREFLQWKDYP